MLVRYCTFVAQGSEQVLDNQMSGSPESTEELWNWPAQTFAFVALS